MSRRSEIFHDWSFAPNRLFRASIGLACALLLAGSSISRADLVRLKSGGEIRGQVDRKSSGPSSSTVVIETLSGATIVIDRAQVQFVSRRPLLVEEYETLARRTPDTVKDQWQLAEWCRKSGLRNQRETHLTRVVEIDPAHEEAHQALGHTLHDGVWMTRDELMTSQGYVKYKGKYITQQELDLHEKTRAEIEAEREWFGKVRLWHGWITGRNDDRRVQGLEELKKIDEPAAVVALSKTFADETNPALRAIYLQILEGIPGDRAVPAIVRQSLHDVDNELRYRALNALKPEQHSIAAPYYVRELRNDQNPIVCRAGQALARVGDESCIPKLIEALVTTHKYKVSIPEKKGSLTMGTNGAFSLGGGSAGNMLVPPELAAMIASGQVPPSALSQGTGPPERVRVVTIKYDHQNAEVLATLQRMTGESFGYEERTWNLWWTAKKTTPSGS